jgi:hypothetical protein
MGKSKSNPKSGGGGFGVRPTTAPSSTARTTASADRDSLEVQWDAFASITNLEIVPPGDPGDAGYEHFEVADVFVRAGPTTIPRRQRRRRWRSIRRTFLLLLGLVSHREGRVVGREGSSIWL